MYTKLNSTWARYHLVPQADISHMLHNISHNRLTGRLVVQQPASAMSCTARTSIKFKVVANHRKP